MVNASTTTAPRTPCRRAGDTARLCITTTHCSTATTTCCGLEDSLLAPYDIHRPPSPLYHGTRLSILLSSTNSWMTHTRQQACVGTGWAGEVAAGWRAAHNRWKVASIAHPRYRRQLASLLLLLRYILLAGTSVLSLAGGGRRTFGPVTACASTFRPCGAWRLLFSCETIAASNGNLIKAHLE